MKRKCFSVLLLLFLMSLVFLPGPLPVDSAGPRRIEVVVTRNFGGLTAPAGQSFVILYWEEPGNTAANSVNRVFEAQVAETGVTWQDRGLGVRVTSVGPDRQEYIGYYRYPATITAAAAVINHRNYIYRVGASVTADFNEARVYPPLESAHTNYQKHTDTCAGCHRTHRAVHPMLLNRRLMREMCLECHDGRSSKYNVLDGRVNIGTGWVDSPAGPFWRVDAQGNQLSTSFHNVFLEQAYAWRPGDPAYRMLYAPGGGGDRYNLTCTDCHSAHVTDRSSPFRLLKSQRQAPPVTAFPFVSDGRYQVLYVDGMNSFCATCHEQYNYGASTALGYPLHVLRTQGGTGIRRSGEFYRHPTNINVSMWAPARLLAQITLPMEIRPAGRFMTCKTCHFAHGSVVRGTIPSWEMTALGIAKYDRFGRIIPEGRTTKLKRSDGMGICLQCHLDQIWGNTPFQP